MHLNTKILCSNNAHRQKLSGLKISSGPSLRLACMLDCNYASFDTSFSADSHDGFFLRKVFLSLRLWLLINIMFGLTVFFDQSYDKTVIHFQILHLRADDP